VSVTPLDQLATGADVWWLRESDVEGLAAAADYLDANPSLADVYVTHVHPAPQAQDAFDAAVRPAPAQIKVTLGYR